jgi:hypothetical protein
MKRLKKTGPTLNLRLRMEGIYNRTEDRETERQRARNGSSESKGNESYGR